jgi:hypothetical protein
MRTSFGPAMDRNLSGTVLFKLKGLLRGVNDGSKPEENVISMLVMMSPEYIKPIADLIHIVQDTYSTDEDLDLVWELFEIIWCFGHPVYKTHTSRDLDILCEHITKRKDSFARKRRVERVDELLWIGRRLATSSRFVGVYGAFRDVWMDSILPLVLQCEGHCV